MTDELFASLLKEAAAEHHLAEPKLPEHHWADWYAPYIRARSTLTNGVRDVNPAEAAAVANLAIEHPGIV